MAESQLREPERKMLSIDEFLDRAKPKTKTLDVPELGGSVVIRALTVKDREEIMSASQDLRTGKVREQDFMAVTVLKGLVEPKLSTAHVERLRDSQFGVIAKISTEIWSISGVDGDAKNASGPTPSAATGS